MKIEIEYDCSVPDYYADKHGSGVDTIEKMIAEHGLKAARWFCCAVQCGKAGSAGYHA